MMLNIMMTITLSLSNVRIEGIIYCYFHVMNGFWSLSVNLFGIYC